MCWSVNLPKKYHETLDAPHLQVTQAILYRSVPCVRLGIFSILPVTFIEHLQPEYVSIYLHRNENDTMQHQTTLYVN